MKTRVGIIGTSGALMADGWCGAFERAAPEFQIVGNASLGSSHPAMLPYRLPLLDDLDLDVLIIDLCVNEQRAVNRNLYDLEGSRAYFDWLRGWCADRGVLPVFAILPLLSDAGFGNGSAVRDIWAGMCRDAGLPFLDGYRMIRYASFYSGIRLRQFFLNPHHFNARGSTLFARVLTSTLSQFLLHMRTDTETALAHDFRFVHAGGQVARDTALLSENLLPMALGDAAHLSAGGGQAVGVVLNMARSNAALVISGDTALAKRLDSPFYDPDGRLRLVAWSLLSPVGTEDGEFSLTVQPVRELSGQEDNDHSTGDQVAPQDDPRVEIAGLILRTPAVARRLLTASGANPDLLSLLS